MERDQDTLNAFIQFLISHGYPPESIVLEYPAGRYRTDLAVIDLKTKFPIAIFEFKRAKTVQSVRLGKEQLRNFISKMENPNVPTYLVFGKQGHPPFEYMLVSSGKPNDDSDGEESLLPYNILQSSGKQSALAEKKKKQKKAFDWFYAVCWFLALVLIILLLLQKLNILAFETEELIQIGVVFALIIIPFASELNLPGFGFKRLKDEV